MQYLARWRMQVAAGLLVRGTSSVAEVAAAVGYDSEAAFSRAFKKHVGTSPGRLAQGPLAARTGRYPRALRRGPVACQAPGKRGRGCIRGTITRSAARVPDARLWHNPPPFAARSPRRRRPRADRPGPPARAPQPAAARAAVTHGEGPLLILAGAGSGKTRVITHRIAWLVGGARADPRQILAITFTNKAAEEMRERAESCSATRPAGAYVGTFHAFGLRLLTDARARRPASRRPSSIYDTADQLAAVAGVAARNCRLDDKSLTPRRSSPDLAPEERAGRRPTTRGGPGADAAGDELRPGLRPLRRAAQARRRDRLRRPAGRAGRACSDAARRRATATPAVPLRPGRRVPGHQPRRSTR